MSGKKFLNGKISRRDFLLMVAGTLGLAGYRSVENDSDKIKNYGNDSPYFNVGFNSNEILLVYLSMDVEQYGDKRDHIPSAIRNACKNIDFVEENLGVRMKYTFLVTQDCAYHRSTIQALDEAIESYGDKICIGSHSRHLKNDVHGLLKEETSKFVDIAKTSWQLLVRVLGLKDDGTFPLRTPAHSSNPYLLDALESEIEEDIILFHTVYTPKGEIRKESFNPNPKPIEYNNPTPISFPFHYMGHERITNVPLTLPRLSSNGLGNYLTEYTLRESVKSHIKNVKDIEISSKNCKFLTHYVHSHDCVMDFAKDRFQESGIVNRHYKSCLNAFTHALVKIFNDMKDDDQVNDIEFLSPADFRNYAISYEQYEK